MCAAIFLVAIGVGAEAVECMLREDTNIDLISSDEVPVHLDDSGTSFGVGWVGMKCYHVLILCFLLVCLVDVDVSLVLFEVEVVGVRVYMSNSVVSIFDT